MKLKVFTLRINPETGVFDDSELQAFLEHHEALAVHEHFFLQEQVPTWALMVSYRDPTAEQPRALPGLRGERRATAPVEVSAEDKPLYEALRRWRNERAKRQGRPAYVLFSNRQLADISRLRPTTLVALQEIEGIGEGRAKEMGREVLALVRSKAPAIEEPQPPEPTGEDTNG